MKNVTKSVDNNKLMYYTLVVTKRDIKINKEGTGIDKSKSYWTTFSILKK